MTSGPNEVPVLVLLPGLGGTGELFLPLVQALKQSVDCKVISYPTTHFLDYAELIAFVRERLPKSASFALLAESFSGPIGISIAANPPANLGALILCCTFARFPDGVLRKLGALLNVIPPMRPPLSLLDVVLMGRWRTGELSTDLRVALTQTDPRILRARAVAALGVDVREDLSKINIPALSLSASCDHLVPRAAQTDILRGNPKISGAELRGPHFLLQCNPVAAAAEVTRFLANSQPK